MKRHAILAPLALASVLLLHARPATAHAVCGSRVFPVTLTLDDPGVADEATLPQVNYQRTGADGGTGPGHDTNVQFEYDKRITDTFGFALNNNWNVNQTNGAKTQTGFDDIVLTAKYANCIDPDGEFIVGLGVIREFGRTGTQHIGADDFGNTEPTLYFGKGLGEIGVPALRPFGVTGELSYSFADRNVKATQVPDATTGLISTQFNNGNPNQWVGGVSIQYSIPYLESQVKDHGLPSLFKHLIPLVEITYTSPTTSPGNTPTTWTIAPGVIYLTHWYQVGIEALIPANKAAGTNVGGIVQFHLFLDDLFPHSLGAPLFR